MSRTCICELWFVGILIAAGGCVPSNSSDPSRNEDTGLDAADAVRDTSADSSAADTGTMDSCPDFEDAGDGSSTVCSYHPAGEGCDSGENCYPGASSGRRCVGFNSANEMGDACDGLNACDDGLICLQRSQDQSGTCRPRCDPTCRPQCNPQNSCEFGCDSGSNCLPVFQGVEKLGACVPECTLYPNDSCGSGKNCYTVTPGGATACLPHGSTEEGGSCQRPTDCGNDMTCVEASGDASSNVCRDKCVKGENACESGESCVVPDGAPFGICR